MVAELSSYAAGLARAPPALDYRAGMTTNGYLLDAPTFASLAAVGVLDYQISLDDPRNTIGRLRSDGTLALRQERVGPWLRGLRDLDAATLACPLVGLAEE